MVREICFVEYDFVQYSIVKKGKKAIDTGTHWRESNLSLDEIQRGGMGQYLSPWTKSYIQIFFVSMC